MFQLDKLIALEVENEKKRQKVAYEAQKIQEKALYDAVEGNKEIFAFVKFKLDDKKIKQIKEKYVPNKKQINETFLPNSTAKGLRLTCKSTIELSKHLLENCGFQYVLTRKMNQDCLEVR